VRTPSGDITSASLLGARTRATDSNQFGQHRTMPVFQIGQRDEQLVDAAGVGERTLRCLAGRRSELSIEHPLELPELAQSGTHQPHVGILIRWLDLGQLTPVAGDP
jgi:hypothetical protein